MGGDVSSSQELVEDFFSRWNDGVGATLAAMQDFMAKDCVWKNSGFPDAVGLEASIALMDGFCKALGLGKIGVETTRYVTQGDDVVTERRDVLFDEGGNTLASMDVLGIFKVKNGRIVSWHDYADPREALAIAEKRTSGARPR